MLIPAGLQNQLEGSHDISIDPSVTFTSAARIVVRGRNHRLVIGPNTDLGGGLIMIRGRDCTVTIGKNCRFKGGSLSVAGHNSRAVIGDETTWESGQIISEGGVTLTIGRDCMFSNNIMIRTSDGHGIFDLETKMCINLPAPVTVEDHVWIGNGARVGKGCRIGEGSVLGQFALLTGDMDKRSAYGGIPARKIKANIGWSRTFDHDDLPQDVYSL